MSSRRPDRTGLVAPAVAVLLTAVLLGALVGTWPPFVAVESGSMAPGVERGDLVVVTAADRAPWGDLDAAADPNAPDRLGEPGDVVVYTVPGAGGRPVFHRLSFAVDAGEDWTERADPALLSGDCAELATCPAPYDGYVTRGDANDLYDQSAGIAPVVPEAWIAGKALFAVPNLGWIRVGIDAAAARYGGVATGVVLVGVAGLAGGVGALFLGRLRRGRRR
ncbi:S26 family signal peptidase [Halorubrum sp. GN11_10-6_MGM]|uniref:S26 family signal peptidase n=1 Tax=Halorubrum sp. GN11_10-6_MGM TaxID=2518112 RepID=UPI0010F4EC10|nr:S26 family signal peptidase [Halorubrum sp. GN11_10-6_MGM]TKX74081.1 S26 family signal peptidase [Halorubrum sp. GN11_10-6_MGM]